MNKDPRNTLRRESEGEYQKPQIQWTWIIQELFIDIFSRLGAGLIFLFLAGLALAEPVDVWLRTYSGASSSLYGYIKSTGQVNQGGIPLFTHTDLPLFVTVAVFFLAILAGLIFSRLDIKTPDRISFQRRAKCIWWDYLRDKDREEIDKLTGNGFKKKLKRTTRAIRRFAIIAHHYLFSMHIFDIFPQHYKGEDNEIKNLFIKELMCTCKADCEFPYFYLKKYLEIRGYKCLADFIPWECPPTKVNDPNRSRGFITILKLRLSYYTREDMIHIAHNEALVRFMSSMWWAARVVFWISSISIIIMIFYNYYGYIPSHNGQLSSTISILLKFLSTIAPLPMFALIIAALLRWGITNQLHDLRMREVFYILAAAYTLSRHYPFWFEDIPEFKADVTQSSFFAIQNRPSD